ncbi:MAG: hypothetical protein AABZ39_06480 [Spirochaetota bacterium]
MTKARYINIILFHFSRVIKYNVPVTVLLTLLISLFLPIGNSSRQGMLHEIASYFKMLLFIAMTFGFAAGALLHEYFLRNSRILYSNFGLRRSILYLSSYVITFACVFPLYVVAALL